MERSPTESAVKPILRQAGGKRGKKKRLSFAAAEEREIRGDSQSSDKGESDLDANPTTILEEFPRDFGTLPDPSNLAERLHPTNSDSSAASDDEEMQPEDLEVEPVCKSLRICPAGVYYVPPSRKHRQYSESLPIIPLKENTRQVFKTAVNCISSTTAKVLIIGNKCDGKKIRDNLLSLQETQKSNWSMRWTLHLDILVDESPSPSICSDTNFFIFLAQLDALDSLVTLSEQLDKIRNTGALPSVCGIVLYMTSLQGTFRNVITNESLDKFYTDHRLPYIHWGKPDKDHYLKILHRILDSLGYNSGMSLLTKGVLRWSSVLAQ